VNVKLVLEYDGSGFHGWQAQAAPIRTVEGVLTAAIRDLTGESVHLAAAGRTDAGVHALGQCVNFQLAGGFPLDHLAPALNARLSPDVVVREAQVVPDGFHARFSARSRSYAYRIRQIAPRGAYQRQYAWSVPGPLDVEAMHAAGERLQGRHDFGSFGRSPLPGGHTVRSVHRVAVNGQDEWVTLLVSADAFLYGMMRRIAAALVAVGRRTRPLEWIDELISGAAMTSLRPAPAAGLVQMGVEY
jgi:tRNA pseudouridine38-40 synthase